MNKTIGICLHGQAGDIMSAMAVLKYRNELWGDSKIVWYASKENWDVLKYHDNLEVREFPRGFGYPEMVEVENRKLINEGKRPVWEDWQPLVDENNHMNIELKHNYPSLNDIKIGFFPAPHQMSVGKRHGLEYPNVSKKVFGVPEDRAWHPVLHFSDEEIEMVNSCMSNLPEGKVIAIESFAGSSQSILTGEQVVQAMIICRRVLGKCNFVMVSHKFINGNEQFPEGLINNVDTFSAAHFTVRQCALVVGRCDMLISVSSGIAVAASCWGNPKVPIIQFTGSAICSTQAMALGEFILVTTSGKSDKQAWLEFELKLTNLLNKIK